MPWEITGVRGVAKVAVTLLVRGVQHRVRGLLVTREAEVIGRRRESDVSRALHVGNSVAHCAAHRYSRVNILSRGLVLVAGQTFRGIDACGQNHGMLVKVGKRRRSRKQRAESNQ
jgi:hypothetical protein